MSTNDGADCNFTQVLTKRTALRNHSKKTLIPQSDSAAVDIVMRIEERIFDQGDSYEQIQRRRMVNTLMRDHLSNVVSSFTEH